MSKLEIELEQRLPLAEVSGLDVLPAALSPDGRAWLLAVGDTTSELARAPIDSFPDADWAVERVEGIDDADGSQLEGVAVSPLGRVVLLREDPATLLLLAPGLRSVERSFAYADAGTPELDDDAGSGGESLVIAPDGQVLVVREKRPVRLVGAVVADDGLSTFGMWPLDDEASELLEDVSDAALGPDGRLYLLSDQSRRLARLAPGIPPSGYPVGVEGSWRLPKRLDKPEGLTFLPDGRAVVATDTKGKGPNLFILGGPIAT